MVDQCARHGGALLLAAGKLAGTVADALVEADAFEGFADAGSAFAAVHFGETQRELDVFLEGHARQEIKGLKNHADSLAAVAREFEGRHFREVLVLGDDRSGSGAIEAGNKIEQRGFSGTGASKQGQEFSRLDGKRNVVDGANDGVSQRIVTGDVVELNGWLVIGHGGSVWAHRILR